MERKSIYAKSKLQEIIKQRGYSGVDFARVVNVSQSFISLILRRKRGVMPAKARLICKVLLCEFDDIFTFDSEVQE